MMLGMVSFDTVADEYDAARPSYPPALFDALGDLDGLRVLDIGAGTGIATRDLLDRGASVIAVDTGAEVLRRAVTRSPDLPAVVADGAVLSVRAGSIDLACFAQAWHWLDPATRVAEMHRVLRPSGRWAGWWSHARADDEAWFDQYWSTIERSCPGTHRDQRDTDWGATLADAELFDVEARRDLAWTRTITTDDWMADQASHSYVIGLDAAARAQLLGELRAIVAASFPAGTMSVRYETWLWIATRA
ncbi:MAG: class I SAM-dependent methyltransferase [Acidimicrobiales bacterium]|nr:class I SAM-dependent methyltransferase [Acidimicrobiales bacterium]